MNSYISPQKEAYKDITLHLKKKCARPHARVVIEKGVYLVSEQIDVVEGVTVLGINATIIQKKAGLPVFNIIGDGVVITGITLKGGNKRNYEEGDSINGSDAYTYISGIYSNASNGIFHNLKIHNFTCGINLTCWDGESHTKEISNNKISCVEVSEVDFGVLAIGQNKLNVEQVVGAVSRTPGSGNPAHLIYISDTLSIYKKTTDFEIKNCYCQQNLDSFAYQFKGCENGEIAQLKAINSKGLLSVKHVHNVSFFNLESIKDLETGLGSLYFQSTDDVVQVKDVYIESENYGRSLRLAGTESSFKSIRVKKTNTEFRNLRDIAVYGSDLVLEDIEIVNDSPTGGNTFMALLCHYTQILNCKATHCSRGIQATSLSSNNTIKISESDFTSSNPDFLLYTDNGNNNTFVVR